MKRHWIAPLLFAVILNSCSPRIAEDQKFESLANNYIETLLEMRPEWATGLGDHRYDDRLHDYTLAGVERFRQFNKTYLDSLATIDPRKLGVENRIDFKIMKSNLESLLFGIDTLKEFRWNPLTYNVGGAIYGLIAREFAPLKDRLLSLKERLKAVPHTTLSIAAKLQQNS